MRPATMGTPAVRRMFYCAGAPIECSDPPADVCLDEATLRSHVVVGLCDEGQCTYSFEATICEFQCADAQCRSEDYCGELGAMRCVGSFVQTCNNFTWQTVVDCSSAAMNCEMLEGVAQCALFVCQGGQTRCQGDLQDLCVDGDCLLVQGGLCPDGLTCGLFNWGELTLCLEDGQIPVDAPSCGEGMCPNNMGCFLRRQAEKKCTVLKFAASVRMACFAWGARPTRFAWRLVPTDTEDERPPFRLTYLRFRLYLPGFAARSAPCGCRWHAVEESTRWIEP